jgi:hypothetical protein
MKEKRWLIVAYPEDGMPRREAYTYAHTREQALNKGWRLFPEYHEINAFEE